MYLLNELKEKLESGAFNEKLSYIYACDEAAVEKYKNRYLNVIQGYEKFFGTPEKIALFSAPGRTEIGGNHTDHQHGRVLAASVNLDVIAAVVPNDTNKIRVKSEGYEMDEISLNALEVDEKEFNHASALIRGIAARFIQMGYEIKGMDIYTISNVLKGSGLSSSAAFEVVLGTIINGIYCSNEVDAIEIAKISQYAENVYFGKPSGLMDQMASSVGSIVAIDFNSTEKPIVEKVAFDFTKAGHALCIIDSGADHADLTDEYTAITVEMKAVAAFFGKEYLRQVDEDIFMASIPALREKVSDRAILRAIHFFHDDRRAHQEVEALKKGDFEAFKSIVKKSGQSSFMYLQNVFASSMPHQQAVSLTLAMCDLILGEKGAYRVHGGGFAGTIQAFVPYDMLEHFKETIEKILGKDMCHVLAIRPVGGIEL